MSSHGIQDDMFQEFLLEIQEDLIRLEPDLLSLEESGAGVDNTLIDRAFRTVHSIKGGAGFIEHGPLSDQAHSMENLLMSIRETPSVLTPGMVDELLSGLDRMKLLVGEDASREMGTGDTGPLEALPAPGKGEVVLKPLESHSSFAGKEFIVSSQAVEAALDQRRFIYGVRLPILDIARMEGDIACIGESLSPLKGPGISGSETIIAIASILDKPLVATVLDIPPNHVVFLDRQFTDISRVFDLSWGSGLATSHPTPPRVKVNLELLSRLMDRAGELVLTRNQLRPLMEKIGSTHPQAGTLMQDLDMVTSDIQDTIMQLRMQPVATLFNKYRRVIRDMGRRLNKPVDLRIQGGGVEVDRNILEGLANPLTHLIRNAVDHGIESPELRMARGKPPVGNLKIVAVHKSGHIRIDIMDDGDGMDPDEILARALAQGVISRDKSRRLSNKEKLNLIFLPGFSTSDTVTDISGRGVGMDVVKTNVEDLRGYIELDATKGVGTRVILTIPLTLAIVPSLIVEEGQTCFALPRVDIKEVVHLEGKGQSVENIAGQDVLKLRDQLYPVLRLSHVLDIPIYYTDPATGQKKIDRRRHIADRRATPLNTGIAQLLGLPTISDDGPSTELRRQKERRKNQRESVYVVLVKLGSQCFGLMVERIFDIEETVVEPLSDYLKGGRYFAGSTILGNGQVVMVLDVNGIASGACLAFDSIRTHLEDIQALPKNEPQSKQDIVVFENGKNEFFALPLTAVSRLEPMYSFALHPSGEMVFVQFEDQAWRLIRLEEVLPVTGLPRKLDAFYCLFLKHSNPPVTICARSVVDTIRVDGENFIASESLGPVQSKIFVRGMMVQVLDPKALLNAIHWSKESFHEAIEDSRC